MTTCDLKDMQDFLSLELEARARMAPPGKHCMRSRSYRKKGRTTDVLCTYVGMPAIAPKPRT
jgi:hypothetical protein